MQTHPEFDVVAEGYDQTFTQTPLGIRQRERVWAILENLIQPKPGNALELNAGTGEDALWLASKGWRVVATDASPALTLRLESLDTFKEKGFDLIFSNFGGLNCLNPAELQQLGTAAWNKLNPGGKFIAVVMGRFCWWESLYFLIKGKFRQAFRRVSKEPVDAPLTPQTSIPTWYFAPNELIDLLHVVKHKNPICFPIGFWLPPSYLNPFFAKRPRLLSVLTSLERSAAPPWSAWAADHYLICIEKEG
jgi:SAM-dependent methyltransferase